MTTNWFARIMSKRVFEGDSTAINFEIALIRDPATAGYPQAKPFSPRTPMDDWAFFELQSPPNLGYARKSISSTWTLIGSQSPIVATISPALSWINTIPPPDPLRLTPWHEIAYYLGIIKHGGEDYPGWFDKVASSPIILQRNDTLLLPSQQITVTAGAPAIP